MSIAQRGLAFCPVTNVNHPSSDFRERRIHTYSLNLVLVEVRNLIHDYERDGAAEVDGFVEDEGHDARGEDIVLQVGIPGGPGFLQDIEVYIIL